MTLKENKNIDNDEIDVIELISALWKHKLKIIILTLTFAICSVFYALSIPNQYFANTLLIAAQSDQNNISNLGQIGGLASLAGVNIGSSNQASESDIAIEVMQSRSFIEDFILENELSVNLMAAIGWNESSKKLVFDDKIYDVKSNKWLIENKLGDFGPSSWELFLKFSSILDVTKDKQTGFISVSIEFYSPLLSKEWLDLYVNAINGYMKEKKLIEVTRNIEYLQNEINKTSVSEMREVFYTIIEEQTKNKMLAAVNPEYAFKVVNPSMIPVEKSKPNRSFICIMSTLFGLILSVVSILFYEIFIKKKNK